MGRALVYWRRKVHKGRLPSRMKSVRFIDLYCQQQGIEAADFEAHIFDRALYPAARPLAGILGFFRRDYFQADRFFIEDVARLRRYEDFHAIGIEYSQHHSNGWFLRRVLRLRVSTERMRRIVRDVFKGSVTEPETMDSIAPFLPEEPLPDQR